MNNISLQFQDPRNYNVQVIVTELHAEISTYEQLIN
jgi:hypothetical protein